jgi:hypothetical protein
MVIIAASFLFHALVIVLDIMPTHHAGTMSMSEVEATYKINRRIEAEERALDAASVVFTSTQQEVAEQWGTYDG